MHIICEYKLITLHFEIVNIHNATYNNKEKLKVDWLRAISKKKNVPISQEWKKKLSGINEEDIWNMSEPMWNNAHDLFIIAFGKKDSSNCRIIIFCTTTKSAFN